MRLSLLVVLAVVVSCSALPIGQGVSDGREVLRHRLAARESYVAGQPVTVRFSLENVSTRQLWVLKWYTPLEGFWGDMLVVTRDGVEVPYRGPLAKRGDPVREDYVRIDAGQAAAAEVDLAAAYDVGRPGTYRVAFVGRVHDVSPESRGLPRPRDLHRGLDARGEPASFRIVPP
jgi:hypothetical protein